MKICSVQTKPITGDIECNIADHKAWIKLAVLHQTDCIIFPELSLTGYEPELAKKLAIFPNDHRLDDFQKLSDQHKIVIGVGVPTKSKTGICISMIIFQPNTERNTYSKKYLHIDEEPFFVPGENIKPLIINEEQIAIAICYEISIQEHIDQAIKHKATLYMASVAKFTNGIEKANHRLTEIAKTHHITTMMSNAIGKADNGQCAGNSSVWDEAGHKIGQLNNSTERFLVFDTKTKKLTTAYRQ
ncbi:carbon-nitrogen hydrolase family protein [Aquimarina algiphila]|uniref:carbon-nitrogen hydrolase family protein n=1 Tax=Aquimarina algiphila TaxID=2047982 RepID=UPI00232EF4A5|nr:carbon-nitrogen hydrolase family protein [Aquimarina algiphila]